VKTGVEVTGGGTGGGVARRGRAVGWTPASNAAHISSSEGVSTGERGGEAFLGGVGMGEAMADQPVASDPQP